MTTQTNDRARLDIRYVGQPMFSKPDAEPYPREYALQRMPLSRYAVFELRTPARMTAAEIQALRACLDIFLGVAGSAPEPEGERSLL